MSDPDEKVSKSSKGLDAGWGGERSPGSLEPPVGQQNDAALDLPFPSGPQGQQSLVGVVPIFAAALVFSEDWYRGALISNTYSGSTLRDPRPP